MPFYSMGKQRGNPEDRGPGTFGFQTESSQGLSEMNRLRPILHRRKLRHRKVIKVSQDHNASK